jgi:hypothetical protein
MTGANSGMSSSIKNRRLAARLTLLAVYVLLLVVVFNMGKGHTLILDDQDADDGSYKAIEGISVSVNGADPVAFEFGLDRDMAKVVGQRHRIKIEGLPEGKTAEAEITLSVWDETVLVALPRIAAGTPPYALTFVPREAPAQPDDRGQQNPSEGEGPEPPAAVPSPEPGAAPVPAPP